MQCRHADGNVTCGQIGVAQTGRSGAWAWHWQVRKEVHGPTAPLPLPLGCCRWGAGGHHPHPALQLVVSGHAAWRRALCAHCGLAVTRPSTTSSNRMAPTPPSPCTRAFGTVVRINVIQFQTPYQVHETLAPLPSPSQSLPHL